MLTNNYYNWLQAQFGATLIQNSFKKTTSVKDTNLYFNTTKCKIFLGSGDSQPTRFDYALEEHITTLTLIATTREPSVSQDFDNSSMGQRISATFRNDTSEAITVKEIGVCGTINTSNAAYNESYLMSRNVITPIIIYPGESYTFTVTIGG